MSMSFNNPLIIGDINKKIQNEIGDLQDLETVDKSSLVNALNEALDSTLNGASKDLNNLSTTGTQKLRSLNAYANEGELLTDTDGLAFVKNYAHSTFDLSKFTVVGSPNITEDGIASGFVHNTSYLTYTPIQLGNYNTWEVDLTFTTGNSTTGLQRILSNTYNQYYNGIICTLSNNKFVSIIGSSGTSASDDIITDSDITNNSVETNTSYHFNCQYNGTSYVGFLNGIKIFDKVSNLKCGTSLNYGHIGDFAGSAFGGSIDLKQFSITVDGVEVFSGNKTGIDTIKPDDYTVVGTPTISSDGIASGLNTSNYIRYTTADILNGKSWKTIQRVYWDGSTVSFLMFAVDNAQLLITGYKELLFNAYTTNNTQIYIVKYSPSLFSGAGYYYIGVSFEYATGTYTIYGGTTLENITSLNSVSKGSGEQLRNLNNSSYIYSCGYTNRSYIDLNSVKIYVDGNLVYQPCLKIPFTESKTGSKIVDAVYRERVNDMAEQFGYANYYTLDEDNGNFTLPQVELYGLIGQRTLRDSYRNGINYWELYSNRDLEQGGSCTSGVEVTFARPFADTTYVLSVPYSAKSATAFTPTQTGDWIAKGKGIL